MQCHHVACIWSVLMRSIMHLKLHFKGRSCSFALVLFADDLMHAYRVFDQLCKQSFSKYNKRHQCCNAKFYERLKDSPVFV